MLMLLSSFMAFQVGERGGTLSGTLPNIIKCERGLFEQQGNISVFTILWTFFKKKKRYPNLKTW